MPNTKVEMKKQIVKHKNSPGLCPGRVRSPALCNKKCSKNSNTFFNKFCLTFVSTLTNWTELLNFVSNHFTFFAPIPFFSQQIQNNAQQLLKQLFLFEKARARGGAFGEPSGFPFVSYRPHLRFGGFFFWTDFQKCFFL